LNVRCCVEIEQEWRGKKSLSHKSAKGGMQIKIRSYYDYASYDGRS